MPSVNRTVFRVWSSQCRTEVAWASVTQVPVTLVTYGRRGGRRVTWPRWVS